MEKYDDVRQIIRRKAKRLERVNDRLHYLKYDIKDFILDEEILQSILSDIDIIIKFATNDDKEENEWNKDNFNGYLHKEQIGGE